ncbi:Protein kinase NEK family protein [Giardia duodenalis]|uniref:Protein kinase NEK family protein n=1 Tax=Giardia intestinalis TaxID=5741 RepID=V6TRF0_GIAIN|nr:Protein kinase NEK family protein [Giardia intestinalis]
MANRDLVLTAGSAKSGTSGVPTFSLDELNRCRGQLLGGGAFGKVYAINGFPSLAVKEIYLGGQPDRLKEVTKFELGALSQFSHPGVLKYHQVLAKGEFFYVVMDRYSSDLDKFIAKYRKNRESIPKELLLSIARQLADALAYVHAPYKVNEEGDVLPGIVHRDLKPDNVLMNRDGDRVAIADFGLCKDAQHDGNTFAGSPSYMAPEVFIYQKTSRASDIWALGVIIYELITLKRPSFSHYWEPEDAKEFFVDGWRPDLSAIEDDFIKGILERIFVLDPIERPTAGELASRLRTLSTSASELATQNSVSGEGHELQVVSDSGSFKARSSWTPLMRAAAAGDIKAVKKHLSKAGKKDNRKDMALIVAAKAGHIDVVELLDPTDGDGVTALMRAVDRNDIGAMRALIPLQKGNKMIEDTYINGLRISNGTALMMAAAHGHAEAVKLLVEEESNIRDSAGKTALMHAVHNNHPGVVRILVTYECGKTYSNGRTALMIAAERGHTEIVVVLAPHEKGLADSSGRTALMLAANNAHIETVRRLVEHEKGMRDNQNHNALYYGLRSGHMEVVDVLIEDDDPTDKNGVTALMRAADRGDVEAVRLLIPLQKEIKDKYGNMAFIHALNNSHVDAALLLREYEAPSWTPLMCAAFTGDARLAKKYFFDTDKKNSNGDTALMIAARAGHIDVVELLDPTDKYGVTALMRAVDRNDVEAVRVLMPFQKGRKTDYCNTTALMRVATRGYEEVVKLLVEYEGGLKDENGWTALMYAARFGHSKCVKLLLEKESCMQDRHGWTALMVAIYNNNLKCAKLLAEREKDIKSARGETALDIPKGLGCTEIVSVPMVSDLFYWH